MAGILADRAIRTLFDEARLIADSPLDNDQIQPASLDLRLGSKAFRVRASFLPGTLEDVYEPFLILEGFLKRTRRGREATALAYAHLGYPGGPPASDAVRDARSRGGDDGSEDPGADQGRLF